MNRRAWIGSTLLLVMVAATGVSLAAWKYASVPQASINFANRPEPVDSVMVAVAKELKDRSPSVNAASPKASMRVRVPVGPAVKSVTVPVKALLRGPSGDQVFVIAPDTEGRLRAYMRHVESGAILGGDVVIRAGLSPGERVAASGVFKLREAVLVAISNEREAGSDVGVR